MTLLYSIIFFFSVPLFIATKNKTELLHLIDPTLDPKESCVICKYVFQKLSNLYQEKKKKSSKINRENKQVITIENSYNLKKKKENKKIL